MIRRSRRTAVAVVLALGAAALTSGGGVSNATSGATTSDAWGAKVTLRTANGWYASPVHSALLPDGRVLMWGLQRPIDPPASSTAALRAAWIYTPPPITQPEPSEVTVQAIDEPIEIDREITADGFIEDDLYCAGHTFTVDGKLFTAGGNLRVYHDAAAGESFGVDYQTLFDYQDDSWTRLQGEMVGTAPSGGRTRWYPAVTRLPDGRMLIQGGFDKVLPTPEWNGTVEVWDPNSQANVLISPYGWTPPEVMNSTYTHAFVLPTRIGGRQILEFGEPGVPVLMDTTGPTATWRVINDRPRPGSEQFNTTRLQQGRNRWVSELAPNWGASSAMLPIRVNNGDTGYSNGSVAIAGGSPQASSFGTVDSYDPVANVWTVDSLEAQRNFPMTVGLPDGRMLILGGGGTSDPNLRHAEYLDPRNGFTTALGTADGGEVRGYHATSLLLPDGRVLVGGGRDVARVGTFEKPSFRYYYPDYMKKVRPRLYISPATLNPATPYAVWTNRPVKELVMVALGSQTHSYDMNQRVVQVPVLANLPVSSSYNVVIGGGLPGPQTLPPGYYMLFAVDENRVPSVARIVKVNPLAGASS